MVHTTHSPRYTGTTHLLHRPQRPFVSGIDKALVPGCWGTHLEVPHSESPIQNFKLESEFGIIKSEIEVQNPQLTIQNSKLLALNVQLSIYKNVDLNSKYQSLNSER